MASSMPSPSAPVSRLLLMRDADAAAQGLTAVRSVPHRMSTASPSHVRHGSWAAARSPSSRAASAPGAPRVMGTQRSVDISSSSPPILAAFVAADGTTFTSPTPDAALGKPASSADGAAVRLPAQRLRASSLSFPAEAAPSSPVLSESEPSCVFCSLYASVRMKLTITGAEQRRFCRKCSREDPPPGARLCTNPLCRELYAPDAAQDLRRCLKCQARLYTKRK